MSSRQLKIIVLFLCTLLCTPLFAVETIIVGEIIDEMTGEAIPNVNIHFRGTKIGTTSDEHGNYVLRVDMSAKSQLVFSAVGYYTQRFDIDPGAMAGLQVAMREKAATLTEIGELAFAGCDKFTKVSIPAGVNEIKKGVFKGCKHLVNVTFAEGLYAVGDEAFLGCSMIERTRGPWSGLQSTSRLISPERILRSASLLASKEMIVTSLPGCSPAFSSASMAP